MLEYHIEGDERLGRRLRDFERHLDNWPEFWNKVVDEFHDLERLWFDTEGAGTWPPLSPAYAARKAIERPGKPILEYYGSLRDSFTLDRDSIRMEGSKLLFETDTPYATYHHTGTRKMPKRDPLIPLDMLEIGIARLLRQWTDWSRQESKLWLTT